MDQSGNVLLQRALSDARALHSVHETQTGHHKQATIKFSDDVSTSGGRQVIRLSNKSVARVLVVGKAAYFSGNLMALTKYFGFSAASARAIGTRWVTVPRSSSSYSTVASDATLGSALSVLKLTGHLTVLAPSVIRGRHVIGLVGTAAVNGAAAGTVLGTVYVTESNRPLPVAVKLSDGRTSLTAYFDHWGEQVSLKAPLNTWSPPG